MTALAVLMLAAAFIAVTVWIEHRTTSTECGPGCRCHGLDASMARHPSNRPAEAPPLQGSTRRPVSAIPRRSPADGSITN